MPTYDYECDACGHAFEEFQSMTAKVLKKCPKCAKPKLRRLIGTGAGIIFKGSGFYETDYRSDTYGKDAKADKDGGSGGDSKDAKGSKNKDDAQPDKASSGDRAAKKADSPKKSSDTESAPKKSRKTE